MNALCGLTSYVLSDLLIKFRNITRPLGYDFDFQKNTSNLRHLAGQNNIRWLIRKIYSDLPKHAWSSNATHQQPLRCSAHNGIHFSSRPHPSSLVHDQETPSTHARLILYPCNLHEQRMGPSAKTQTRTETRRRYTAYQTESAEQRGSTRVSGAKSC